MTTIAPHILGLALFLSVMWGIFFIHTVQDYRRADGRKETVIAFRRMIVAVCVWLLPVSFVFRTACVLLGVGDDVVGQIAFFAMVGPNVVGSIFAVVSLKYD